MKKVKPCVFFQTESNATRDAVEHVAADVESLSENVENLSDNVDDLSENLTNATLLLNECVKQHLGYPWFDDWLTWGFDIIMNRVPSHSDFFRPATLGQWLNPQALMMGLSYALCHVLSYIDARCGSRLSKNYKFKLGPVAKVGA